MGLAIQRVVFAGGGHRCWWQAGWWDVAAGTARLAPTEIAAVSAGAATACLLYANDTASALAHYHSVLGPGARNAYWGQWRSGLAGVFPHERIYRDALHSLLGGPHFTRLQRQAPQIRIAFSRAASWMPLNAATVLGLAAYNTEKYLFKPLHPRFGRRVGFRTEVATVQSCSSADELVDLIIQSSCTPPFTAVQFRDGRPTLDGGLVDNVPVDALTPLASQAPRAGADEMFDAGDETAVRDNGVASLTTLVLVTRRYPGYDDVFRVGDRLYVQPSRKVAASAWDYTAPQAYQATYAQGREDAAAFLRWLEVNS